MQQKNVDLPHTSQRGTFILRKKQAHTESKREFVPAVLWSMGFRVQQEEASHGSGAPVLHNISAVV